MNFIRKWFCKEFEYVEEQKNISEPTISFVECVRNNPKRFKVTHDFEYTTRRLVYDDHIIPSSTLPETYHYTLKDTQTLESWTLTGGSWIQPVYSLITEPDGKHTINPEWLTKDEREYLIVSLKAIMNDRKGRREKLIDLRRQRRIRDERNRLKDIYCV